MSLYLCIFIDTIEAQGLDMGSYSEFNAFRTKLLQVKAYSRTPYSLKTLLYHSDCEGEWTPKECKKLIFELNYVRDLFLHNSSENGRSILATIESLLKLARFSIKHNSPIQFQ